MPHPLAQIARCPSSLGMRPLAAPLAIAALLTGAVTASEGTLLARRSLGALSVVYLSSVAFLPFMLTRASSAAAIWRTFGLFQLIRAVAFSGRVWLPRVTAARSAD